MMELWFEWNWDEAGAPFAHFDEEMMGSGQPASIIWWLVMPQRKCPSAYITVIFIVCCDCAKHIVDSMEA